MNGLWWNVLYIPSDDPKLVDRTGRMCVATTDPHTSCVYLSKELRGDFLVRVFVHEIGHCAIFSYNLINDIHEAVYPYEWVLAEEWICNLFADYGQKIFAVAEYILKRDIA